MIKAIEGKITKKEPTYVWLKTAGGVTYGVAVSLFSAAKLERGEVRELLISEIIREDADLLFGFLTQNEQEIFEMLLKVSGIGAATAMAVCSTLAPDEVGKAVMSGDVEAFKKVPGIGPKTAKMVIATLSDAKFGAALSMPSHQNDAFLALEGLGFKKEAITKVLGECAATDTATLVKEALKKLSQKG